MSKIIGFILAIVVIFAALVYVAGPTVVSGTFEDALGVPVDVKSTSLDVFKGRAILSEIVIHNPPGFEDPVMASIPELKLDFDLWALANKTIKLKNAELYVRQVNLERSGSGEFNIFVFRDMHQKQMRGATRRIQETKRSPGEAKKPKDVYFELDRFVFSIDSAKYYDSGRNLERRFSLNIQDETFEDITEMNEVIGHVIGKIVAKISLDALLPDVNVLTSLFGPEAKKKLGEMQSVFTDAVKEFQAAAGG